MCCRAPVTNVDQAGRERLVVPVRRLLAHVVAQLGEQRRGSPSCRARLLVDRNGQRSIESNVDPEAPGRPPRRLGEGLRWRGEPAVVAGLVAGHRVECQRRVEGRAGDRAVGRGPSADVAEVGSDRNAPAARLQADDTAAGGRDADRAAEVAALGQADHARCDRSRAAARGAARGESEVPRVAGNAEALRLGHGPQPELGRVRLADDDRARLAQPADVGGVVVGDPVAERRAAVRSREPIGGAEQILDGERHAAERSLVTRAHRVGLGQRTLRAANGERVDRRIEALDRLERGPHQLPCGQLP